MLCKHRFIGQAPQGKEFGKALPTTAVTTATRREIRCGQKMAAAAHDGIERDACEWGGFFTPR